MCKVLIVPKINDKTRTNALKFMNAMKPLMSVGNKDGLGYAAIDSAGALFGERWLTNEDSYLEKKSVAIDLGESLRDLATTVYSKAETGAYNSFGVVNLADIAGLTMHTRFATSGKEFRNTHPFVHEEHDTSLVHNGVISNTQDFKFAVSSCDSEALLISYVNKDVNKDVKHIQDAANMVKGYYACGVFSRDEQGERILDVFKGPDASLYGMYVQELDSLVFCTSMDDVLSACKTLGFTNGKVFSMKEGFLLRFKGGVEVCRTNFTPAPRWSQWFTGNSGANATAGTNTLAVITKYRPKKETISADMSKYLHTIPNIQQIMN